MFSTCVAYHSHCDPKVFKGPFVHICALCYHRDAALSKRNHLDTLLDHLKYPQRYQECGIWSFAD